MSKKILLMLFALFMATVLVACGSGENTTDEGTTGGDNSSEDTTDENEASGDVPDKIIMGFVPSTDADKIADNIKPLEERLEQELGIPVEGQVMTNFTALVEAMGNDQVHIGFIPAFGYVQVTERYDNVEVFAKSIRHGSSTYKAQYTVRTDSDIQTLEDLEGKIWAYPDQSSTSGFLFPAAQFMDDYGVTDLDAFFGGQIQAGNHDNALITVLEGDADFATTFDDARTNIEGDYPEAMEELRVLGYTDEIPNDTISANNNLLSDELITEIRDIFLSFNDDEEMINVMDEVYNWTGLDAAEHDEYEIVRSVYKKFQEQFD
ncbi:phosphate/phosphite/phosphonate ABC transporter substrate-binding protein [Alkalihalobacillus sp. 1P02AB]|uniref:phosphate/phosphite/phosphonate ABC transporter substrate-binding protein n=1 Tax=Alkalihalobacillus sp. 1P02AB TaxID=3132260 RepID=UPI0039A54A9A